MTAAVLTTVLANAADAELEDWGPLEEATGDPMATHGLEIWVDGDEVRRHLAVRARTVALDCWRPTRSSTWCPGRMTVTPDGGEPSEIGAGDLAVFPIGLDGHLGHPRDRAQGLRHLLIPPRHH